MLHDCYLAGVLASYSSMDEDGRTDGDARAGRTANLPIQDRIHWLMPNAAWHCPIAAALADANARRHLPVVTAAQRNLGIGWGVDLTCDLLGVNSGNQPRAAITFTQTFDLETTVPTWPFSNDTCYNYTPYGKGRENDRGKVR